jgi:hypothetical protein
MRRLTEEQTRWDWKSSLSPLFTLCVLP